MPSLAEYRAELLSDWTLAASKLASAKIYGQNLDAFFMMLGGFPVLLDWIGFRGDLCYCCDRIIEQVGGPATSPLILWMTLAESEFSGGEEFSMDLLLTTMIGCDYEQFQNFIGIVDGYRVALWNNWFNAEYYAALARGFLEKAP